MYGDGLDVLLWVVPALFLIVIGFTGVFLKLFGLLLLPWWAVCIPFYIIGLILFGVVVRNFDK